MYDEGYEPAPESDPEIAPLLEFPPVHRHTRRSDGWQATRQRDFIFHLSTLGNVDFAAQMVGRTASGAYKVRTSAGAEGFAAAWDGALALWHRRNPKPLRVGRPSRGELLTRPLPIDDTDDAISPEEEAREQMEFLMDVMTRYLRKLASEREARMDGRIVEADFYVRQLTFIEIVLDLGGNAQAVLERLERRDLSVLEIAATPMSVLLDQSRRDMWGEGGEPERPPLGDLGEHDGDVATGPPNHYSVGRDGDHESWRRCRDEGAELAAQAQVAWEKKARADAKRWRKRVAAENAGRTVN